MRESFRERLIRRALLALSLAMGLMLGSGIAYGYWYVGSVQTTNAPATLTSGTFDLTVNGQLAGQTGGTYNWDAFSGAQALYPTESWAEQVTFTLGNASTGDHAYLAATIAATATNVTGFQNTSTDSPGKYLDITVYQNATANNTGTNPHRQGTCTGGTQLGTMTTVAAMAASPVTILTTPQINPGDSTAVNLCFVVQVDSAYSNPTVTGLAGGSANLNLTISSQQVKP